MAGQHGISEAFGNAWALLLTKIWFPGARLVRRPFYLRGDWNHLEYGPGLTIGYSCRFKIGPKRHIKLGSNCMINNRVNISSYESVTIGDDVLIVSNISISDNSHGTYKDHPSNPVVAPDDRSIVTTLVTNYNRVWICEDACSLFGETLGQGLAPTLWLRMTYRRIPSMLERRPSHQTMGRSQLHLGARMSARARRGVA